MEGFIIVFLKLLNFWSYIFYKHTFYIILEKYGELKLIEKSYSRFKSHNRTKNAVKKVKEQLYILKKYV